MASCPSKKLWKFYLWLSILFSLRLRVGFLFVLNTSLTFVMLLCSFSFFFIILWIWLCFACFLWTLFIVLCEFSNYVLNIWRGKDYLKVRFTACATYFMCCRHQMKKKLFQLNNKSTLIFGRGHNINVIYKKNIQMNRIQY